MGKKAAGNGYIVTSDAATPLASGNHTYWDPQWKMVILEFLSDSHPNVSVEYGNDADGNEDGSFKATFRKYEGGREICGKSRSLENPNTKIPIRYVDELIKDLDRLHQESLKEGIPDGAKQFLRGYMVPDPREMREAWRVAHGPVKKFMLLWGYSHKGMSNAAVLPQTPTSRNWDDAERRVDLKEALREAGRLGKGIIDWTWLISRILGGILSLLLLLLLFRNCDGCPKKETYCQNGCGMVCEDGGKCKDGCDCGCRTNKVPIVCNCGKQCSDSGKCATECDCGCVTNGPAGQIKIDMCPVHTNIVKIGGKCIATCAFEMEDGSLCGNHLDENWICDKHPEKGSQEDEFEACSGTCGMKHRKGEKCPKGCGCGCNGALSKRFCQVHTGVKLDKDGKCPKVCQKHPDVHLDKDGKCGKCEPIEDKYCPVHTDVKLGKGGKCPKVCQKHPDVHLDKDGKCGKCEPPQPPVPPKYCPVHTDVELDKDGKCSKCEQSVIIPDFNVRCSGDGEMADGSYKPIFELESKAPLPRNARIQWRLDGKIQDRETGKQYNPHFPDGSRRIIAADISWKPLFGKAVKKSTPDFPWFAHTKKPFTPTNTLTSGSFSIVVTKAAMNADGSYDPIFKLESKMEFPDKAYIQWHVDGHEQADANGQTFTMHFPDDSRHEISATINWVDADGKKKSDKADCRWYPGANAKDVKRYVFYVGAREDDVGTYYLYGLGSDPQDGKATIVDWKVEKTSPQKRVLEHDVHDEYLLIHSRDIAGNAILKITATVEIAGKEGKEVSAVQYFGGKIPIETSEKLTVDEVEKMAKAGSGIVPSVFRIGAGNSSGTAFAVTKRHLVTNAHVIDSVGNGGEVRLFRSNSGDQFSGRVVASAYPNADLALVEVTDGPELTALAIANSVQKRQPVVCVGFGVNVLESENPFEPKSASGVVNGYDPHSETMFSDMNTFHGNSGSPVVNESGQVVGVLYMGTWKKTEDREVDRKTELSGIVTLGMLEHWLKQWGVRWGN